MPKKNLLRRITSSVLVKTFLIYVSGGWILLEITDYIVTRYELNERIIDILPIIILIGLPLALFFGWYLGNEKNEVAEESPEEVTPARLSGGLRSIGSRPWITIPAIIILILLMVTGGRFIHQRIKKTWASTKALPQMKEILHDLDYVGAFEIFQEFKKYIPDDPEVQELDPQVIRKFCVLTDPDGVDVYYKVYSNPEDEWAFLGSTPLINAEMPNFTLYRWKLVKEGYDTVFAAAPTHMDTLYRTLHKTGIIPEGMVYVDGISLPGEENSAIKNTRGYFIDKYEVSNQEYKDFMDQGGYRNPAYWPENFTMGDNTISFEEAIHYFTDVTDRPGPSTWEAGDYPDGQDHYPVRGISWYEAAAYAAFAGKNLPTLYHWQSAAGFLFSEYPQLYGSNVVPLSNMDGSETVPSGSSPGMNYFGSYDMAGNVREWCWNKTPQGRIILGGAWNDATYLSQLISQLPAMNRSPKNGFRCILLPDQDTIPAEFLHAVSFLGDNQDYRYIQPVSEAEYQIFANQFRYDRTDLNSQIEYSDDTYEDYMLEKISFDAAYEDERVLAYLFLPKNASPPYQTVIFFPGAYAASASSIMDSNVIERFLDFLLKNGRAVMFPVYKTTYERSSKFYNCASSSETQQYTECMIKVVKDFSRTIDYMETREDIDMSKLCYMGDSWGGRMGAIIPAVEERLKTCVLIRGGLSKIKKYPEATEVNYVSHISVPVLMLNGRYDYTFPYESTVLPMFDLLSTPDQDKRLVTLETEHYIPKSEVVKETLAWLDKYFGPVN